MNLASPNNIGAHRKCPRTLRSWVLTTTALVAITSVSLQAETNAARSHRIQRLVEQGQIDVAEKQVWDVVSSDPENAAAIDLLGVIRVKQKRFPEAEALLKRAIAAAPDSVDSYRDLGELYATQGHNDEAEASFVKAHELAPNDVTISFALAKMLEQTGEFGRSIEAIDSIPVGLRPAGALPIMASDYFALKQPDNVAALIPEVRRRGAVDSALIPQFARVLADNGYEDDADALLKVASATQGSTSELLLVLARVQERQGNVALAERTLAQVTKQYPSSFEAWLQSARLASGAKAYKKEASLLDRALQVRPDDVEALRHLVVARTRSGEAMGAITAARHLYSIKPNDPDVIYLLATALVNRAQWHEARPIAEKLVSARDDARARVMLGMVLVNDGDIDGASLQIDHALQEDPNETEAHYYKGVIARQHGDVQVAIREMEAVVAADPQHVSAQAELGTLSLQIGNLDAARKALEQAVSVNPNVPENHYQLAIAYSRSGLTDKAQIQMEEFRKLRSAADKSMPVGTTAGNH